MNERAITETERLRSLLNEIAELCEGASLSGSFEGGASRVAERYNAVLNRLLSIEALPADLFSPLPSTAGFAEVGVEARMLAGYFRSDERGDRGQSLIVRLAPFVDSRDLAKLIREGRESGMEVDPETLAHIAPFLGKEELGDLLRGHFERRKPPTPPAPPAPPHQEERFPVPHAPHPPARTLGSLLDRLEHPGLTEEERSAILGQIRAITGGEL